MSKLTKPRFVLIYPLVPLLFLIARISEPNLRWGIVLAVLGESLRFWANGYVGHVKVNWTQKRTGARKIGTLITAGPYAYVRHALYLGSFFIGLGVCVIVGRPWFTIAALGTLFVVYRRKLLQEEVVLLTEWGEEYERYRRAVPRYVPTWRRYDRRQGTWSWRGIGASKEWKTVLWVIVLLIALYLQEEIFHEHELLTAKKSVKQVGLLVLLVVLAAGDGLYELARRRKRPQAVGGGAAAA